MNGLDTNILVRHLVQDDPAQAALVGRFIQDECTQDEPCVLNRIVLCELLWVLERAYGYSRETISEALEQVVRTSQFQIEDLQAVWSALRTYRKTTADFSDCLLGETNRQLGCASTVTLDKRASRLDSFRLLG